MTISLILLYAQGTNSDGENTDQGINSGALIYRLVPREETVRMRLKLGHAGIMVIAFILMVVGLQVEFLSSTFDP